MTQQIINYDEEMVGANHPTKSDTLNRGFLINHGINGGLNAATSDPASPEDYQYYWKTDDKELRVYDGAAWQTIGGRYATVDYTGDGNAAQAVTGLGFQASFVMIMRHGASYDGFKGSTYGTKAKLTYYGGDYWEDDHIISIDADGVTVGDGTGGAAGGMNASGQVYTLLGWA